jgi:hypothetical protein
MSTDFAQTYWRVSQPKKNGSVRGRRARSLRAFSSSIFFAGPEAVTQRPVRTAGGVFALPLQRFLQQRLRQVVQLHDFSRKHGSFLPVPGQALCVAPHAGSGELDVQVTGALEVVSGIEPPVVVRFQPHEPEALDVPPGMDGEGAVGQGGRRDDARLRQRKGRLEGVAVGVGRIGVRQVGHQRVRIRAEGQVTLHAEGGATPCRGQGGHQEAGRAKRPGLEQGSSREFGHR